LNWNPNSPVTSSYAGCMGSSGCNSIYLEDSSISNSPGVSALTQTPTSPLCGLSGRMAYSLNGGRLEKNVSYTSPSSYWRGACSGENVVAWNFRLVSCLFRRLRLRRIDFRESSTGRSSGSWMSWYLRADCAPWLLSVFSISSSEAVQTAFWTIFKRIFFWSISVVDFSVPSLPSCVSSGHPVSRPRLTATDIVGRLAFVILYSHLQYLTLYIRHCNYTYLVCRSWFLSWHRFH